MVDYKLSPKLEEATHIAKSIAKEHTHKNCTPAHLLKALMHKSIGVLQFLQDSNFDGYYVEEWAEVRLETLPKASKTFDPEFDTDLEAVLYEADNIKLKLGKPVLDEYCALIALATPGVGFSYDQLKTFPFTGNEVIEHIGVGTSENGSAQSNGVSKSKAPKSSENISKFCLDKTEGANQETLDKISGRDAQIKMIAEILGRRSKPNVLILGDPGVGKTVLFNGLAYASVNNNVPEHLKTAKLLELDFITLTSGAGYKGEIEDRLQKVINEIKQYPKAILLIDELNNLTDKNSGNQGLLNILKSELVKGEVTVIATATNDAFRKHIEPEAGLSRQFEIVKLSEPSEDEAFRMINDTIQYYTEHHQFSIDDETIQEAIRLAKRYNKERSLPDSAIDLIDRTMSAAKFMTETSLNEISSLREALSTLQANTELSDEDVLKEQTWLYASMKNKLSYLLFDQLGEDNLFENATTAEEGFKTLETILDSLEAIAKVEKTAVTKNDVASTIANKTGIPTGKLQSDEKERLLKMEETLQKRVIGQDHAISVITSAVLESRSGLSKPGLPIGSFFFSGPTGTGKTELAKSLAEFLFQDENAIIRFDMSEFKEEHSAALLYGAPPGYVGYEEGGLLVNKIRQNPYSIVLFDEIEKAHASVFDIFLQILDEGKLSDRLGKVGDFSNAVILFTSNIGSQHIVDSFGAGNIPKSSDLLEIMGAYFRPEFLGRLTEIIPFSPITKENVVKIFKIQLKGLYKALEKQDISLSISDNAMVYLAEKGFTPKYGARPLRGVIRNDLRSPLSKLIISGKITKGANINLDVDDNNELVWEY